jgi:DNA-binding transcriptional MocR family regulator
MNLAELKNEYEAFKSKALKLDMSRGKPSPEQLDLSLDLLTINAHKDDTGVDARNYSNIEGIPEARRFFSELLGVSPQECLVGGNSSLELMYHCVNIISNFTSDLKNRKWLCPVPGYDRHFKVTESLGFELISVPMTPHGPDMDAVETLVQDPTVCGIWCVPLYSNPDGYSYSAETVKRMASMKTANPEFNIFWDNAYGFHHLTDTPDTALNILDECKAAGNPHRPITFMSTSKITFAGAGVAALAASTDTIRIIVDYLSSMTIGFDKINQLRHVRFLKSEGGLAEHMKKHTAILNPKFQIVLDTFTEEFRDTSALAHWTVPRGGYFISLYTQPGKAKRVVQLCKEAGVTLTGAGAAFPYGIDPNDCHIRVAPTCPSVADLRLAAKLLALCVKLASAE